MEAMTTQSPITDRADRCIRKHVGYAMAAAVIPVPVADATAIGLVENSMLKSINKIYGRKWREGKLRQIMGIVGAKMVGPTAWASFAKAVPGIGTWVGGSAQMVLAGSICFALGKAYQGHIENGNEDVDADTFKEEMKRHMKEGKGVARSMKKDVQARTKAS